jgi:hypothetical protein
VVIVMVVGGYRPPPETLTAITRKANSVKVLRFSTPAKLYSCETILERLTQDLEDMAAARGPFLQEEHADAVPVRRASCHSTSELVP